MKNNKLFDFPFIVPLLVISLFLLGLVSFAENLYALKILFNLIFICIIIFAFILNLYEIKKYKRSFLDWKLVAILLLLTIYFCINLFYIVVNTLSFVLTRLYL
jgi:hypothetical protein